MDIKFTVCLFSLFLAALGDVRASDQQVTDLGDNGGAGQLRQKIAACQSTAPAGGTITFAPGLAGKITLLAGALPNITTGVTINGGSLISISGNSSSRIFVVNGSGNLTLQNLTVREGHSENGDGGALNHSGTGTVTINNCIFTQNSTSLGWSGGAIITVGKLNISNSEFTMNICGGGGGALYPRFGAVVNITGCNFHDNFAISSAAGWGGAMLIWDGPTVTVSNTVFNNNRGENGGGAIYVLANSTLIMNNNCTLSGNWLVRDNSSGGAIFNAGTATLTGVTISGNAANAGSGIYNNGGTLQLTSVTLDSNNGKYLIPSGGGIAGNGNVTIANSTISNNKVGLGGGIDATGTYVLSNVTLSGNSASEGGAIRITNGSLEMKDGCVVDNNSAMYAGGGIYTTRNISLTNVTFTDNKAAEFGGAIYTDVGGTLRNVTINGNSASLDVSKGRGGGIYSNGGILNLTAVTLSNNSANFAAGGLRNFGQAILTNVTLSGNSAGSEGGGGLTNSGNLTATNVTLTGNSAGSGGGIHHKSGATTTLQNTVVANSPNGGNCFRDPGSSPISSAGGNLSNDNTCADSLTQTNDKNGSQFDPLLGPLANNGGFTLTHHPGYGSPLIDNGVANGAPNVDQRDGTRPQGAAFDIGAVEVLPLSTTLANISTRLRVETGENALIGGFIITGTQPKKVIIRAIGPSLPFAGQLANPTLELYQGSTLLASNDDWQNQPAADRQAVIDSTVPPSHDLESALVRTLPANGSAYTAIVRGVNDGTGIGVVEAFDLDRTTDSKLANISTRGLVQTGNNVLIAGTIVLGTQSQKVIVRAIGPSLPLSGTLANPTLELRDQNGDLVEANDDWVSSPNKQAIIDSTVPPPNDLESAIVRTLAPAAYTAVVRGVNDTTGIAVVEIFALQ